MKIIWTSKLDYVELLEELGVESPKDGDEEIHARCPKHFDRVGKPDRNPSWSISRSTGRHHCFSCGYGGSLVSLVMDMQHVDLFAAHRWLRSHAVATVLDTIISGGLPGFAEEPEVPPTLLPEDRLKRFHTPPEGALRGRRVSRDSAKRFGIRWDRENDAWILPMRTPAGELLGYQIKGAKSFRNYPKGVVKSDCLFGADVFPVGETAVLVESPLDVARLYDLGYHGLSPFGVNVSDKQIQLLIALTDEVVVALDNDSAGITSSRVLRTNYSRRLRMFFFDYPSDAPGKDVGELSNLAVHHGIQRAEYASNVQLRETIGGLREGK